MQIEQTELALPEGAATYSLLHEKLKPFLKTAWNSVTYRADVVGFDAAAVPRDMRPQIMAGLQSVLKPLHRTKIVRELTRLSLACVPQNLNEESMQAKLVIYAADLATYSEYAIVRACAEFRRSSKFFPTTSEFVEKITGIEEIYRMAYEAMTQPATARIASRRSHGEAKPIGTLLRDLPIDERNARIDAALEKVSVVLRRQPSDESVEPARPLRDPIRDRLENATAHLSGEEKFAAQRALLEGRPIPDKQEATKDE